MQQKRWAVVSRHHCGFNPSDAFCRFFRGSDMYKRLFKWKSKEIGSDGSRIDADEVNNLGQSKLTNANACVVTWKTSDPCLVPSTILTRRRILSATYRPGLPRDVRTNAQTVHISPSHPDRAWVQRRRQGCNMCGLWFWCFLHDRRQADRHRCAYRGLCRQIRLNDTTYCGSHRRARTRICHTAEDVLLGYKPLILPPSNVTLATPMRPSQRYTVDSIKVLALKAIIDITLRNSSGGGKTLALAHILHDYHKNKSL